MVPILILGFAGLGTLQKTLDSILSQPHGPIYLSLDGPTAAHVSQCEEVREFASDSLRSGVIQNLRTSEINEGTLFGVNKGID